MLDKNAFGNPMYVVNGGKYITMRGYAQTFGYHYSTVRKWVSRGKIEGIMREKGQVLIPIDAEISIFKRGRPKKK